MSRRRQFFRLALSLTGIFMVASADAQTPGPVSYLVDSVYRNVNTPLPFDVPFILQFREVDAPSLYTGAVARWRRNRSLVHFGRKAALAGRYIDIIQSLKPIQFVPQKKGMDVYINPLPPNETVAIVLGHHYDADILIQALLTNETLRTNRFDIDQILALVDLADSKLKGGSINPAPVTYNMSGWTKHWKSRFGYVIAYRTFYFNKLSAHQDAIFNLGRSARVALLSAADLQKLGPIAHGAGVSSAEFSLVVSALDVINEASVGTYPLVSDIRAHQTPDYRLDLRISNLTASISVLEKARVFVKSLTLYSADLAIQSVANQISAIETAFSANLANIKLHYQAILTAINVEPNLTYTTWAYANSNLFDLKTKGSYYIIPTMGVAGFVGIGNHKNQLMLRPYFGASIYFRAVNKDLPLRSLDHKFLHQFSVNFGVTTGKIAKGEFTDFYNSISLLAGVNLKVTQGIGLSAGTILLRRSNINPAISATQGTMNPYFGITFDLDLLNSISQLTSKVVSP